MLRRMPPREGPAGRPRVPLAALALACVLLVQSLGAGPGAGARAAGAGLRLVRPGFLTVGIDPPYPPMESSGPGGMVGVDPSLAGALAARLGLRPAFVRVSNFDTMLPRLAARQYNVIMTSMSITPDRQRLADFVPYMVVGESIVVAKANPKHVSTLADLSGLNASVSAFTLETQAVQDENKALAAAGRPTILLKTYDDDNNALSELVRGQSDAYLTDYPVAVFHMGRAHGALALAGPQFNLSTYGIALKKGNAALLSALTKGFGAMRRDGSYRQILVRFGVEEALLP